jgi:phosphoribosylformylglycinamidine synthase
VQTLGREPTYTEIGMYSVMWSEHCGYKYSRPVLKAFAEYKKAQETGALENAGSCRLATRVGAWSSRWSRTITRRPSSRSKAQATGVGGILRDIFHHGRPPRRQPRLAPLRPHHRRRPDRARNRYLFEHVVAGVGSLWQLRGVPTVGGEVYFHPCYNGNPLVNAMSIGIVRMDGVASARASGVGNPFCTSGRRRGATAFTGRRLRAWS